MASFEDIADFLVISVGRVGTISAFSEINRHPDLHVFLTENWHRKRIAVERMNAGSRKLGIMCHQVREFGGPQGLPELADRTARQALVHIVRDPLVQVRARYNQAVWDTAYTVAFEEHSEDRLGLTPPATTPLPIPTVESYVLESTWPEVRYHHYRGLFGGFERSLTVDFSDLAPGPALNRTFTKVFQTIGVDPRRGPRTLAFEAGSNLVRTLTIKPDNRFVYEATIAGFPVDGYMTLAAAGLNHDPDQLRAIGVCCRMPWYADAIGLPAPNQEIWFCIDRACFDKIPAAYRNAVCIAVEDHVQNNWAPSYAAVVRRSTALYDAHKIDRFPVPVEAYLRDLLAADVEAMLQEHPRLRQVWTF